MGTMRERWYLKVDGIPGASTDDRHPGEIEVDAWSFGVSGTAAVHVGAGAGAGKAVFQDLRVSSPIGIASPLLLRACAAGSHLRTATLAGVREADDRRFEFLTYTLEDVSVTSVEHADAPGSSPTDHITLVYGRIRTTFQPPPRPDGSLPTAVTAGWDVRANRAL